MKILVASVDSVYWKIDHRKLTRKTGEWDKGGIEGEGCVFDQNILYASVRASVN